MGQQAADNPRSVDRRRLAAGYTLTAANVILCATAFAVGTQWSMTVGWLLWTAAVCCFAASIWVTR